MLSELSSARQALEGEDLAPGNRVAFNQLRDPGRRTARVSESIPKNLRVFRPMSPFQLDEEKFKFNVLSTKKGVAGGRTGRTFYHMRSILDSPRETHTDSKSGGGDRGQSRGFGGRLACDQA